MPFEVAERGETELVGEITSSVPLLVVLVFVEGEGLGGELVHILFICAIHTYIAKKMSRFVKYYV